MSENFEWDSFNKNILKTHLESEYGASYFKILSNSLYNGASIYFYENSMLLEEDRSNFSIILKENIDTTKKIVENTVEHFIDHNWVSTSSLKEHLETQINQLPQQEVMQQPHDPQLETAQKTGYIQGVCESVLAFNNDENRKIMTESTMTFLSKKLLSEMNVTKDLAQKFASPETYKALEQFVFAPKQEQQLEQTQSHSRGM
jgi:hypothetical protein